MQHLAPSLLCIVTESRLSQIAECHLIISQYFWPSPVSAHDFISRLQWINKPINKQKVQWIQVYKWVHLTPSHLPLQHPDSEILSLPAGRLASCSRHPQAKWALEPSGCREGYPGFAPKTWISEENSIVSHLSLTFWECCRWSSAASRLLPFLQPLGGWISQADGLPGLYPSQNVEFSSLLPIPANTCLSHHLHRSQFSATSWKEHYWTEMSYCISLVCATFFIFYLFFLAKSGISSANFKCVTTVNGSEPQSSTV